MVKIKLFETEEELKKLTKLTDDKALWDAGFDMDDFDFGIVLDHPIADKVTYTFYGRDITDRKECVFTDVDYDPLGTNTKAETLIMQQWKEYGKGGTYVEYGGKHYYLFHHY